MAALVCALGINKYVALFVGGVAVYWAVSALRAKPGAAADGGADAGATHRTAPAAHGGRPENPQAPAALGGLFTGGVAVLVVACSIALSLYYQEYNVCVRDALTATADQNCGDLAPKWYVNLVNPSR